MLNVKENVKRLISDIYECQKKISINHRFIGDLLLEGNRNGVSLLQDEIKYLREKIQQFQRELNERFYYSHT